VDYTGIGIKFAGQNQDGFPGRTKFFAPSTVNSHGDYHLRLFKHKNGIGIDAK
jgi:hypothetical protein